MEVRGDSLKVRWMSLWACTYASKEGTGVGPLYAFNVLTMVETCIADSMHLMLSAAKPGELMPGGKFWVKFVVSRFRNAALLNTCCRMSSTRRPSSSTERCCHCNPSKHEHKNTLRAKDNVSEGGGVCITCWARREGGQSCRRLLEFDSNSCLRRNERGSD